jgi:aminopeptidase N
MLKRILFLLSTLIFLHIHAQQPFLYNPSIDAQHYSFFISLSDNNDTVKGRAVLSVTFTEKVNTVSFDLTNVNDTGRGMIVSEVKDENHLLLFTHKNNKLILQLPYTTTSGDQHSFSIVYKGIPADGLIISKNKFGHRTIFSDNWPNRARNWIPCKDHLSDKAAVDFFITAPDHYQVIANGVKEEETNLPNHLRLTHWKETIALPTKVMAIGLADFAVDYPGEVNNIPISSWIFPEQRDKGFYDYGQALDILPFFIKNVGPYPYKKLANVQSKTIFGGMENAGAIFYSEESITGTRKSEDLLTHEMAHQWFGNSATEIDWPHLWLSEGFATAMTHLYIESRYGKDSLINRIKADRKTVIAFTKKRRTPVVDTTARNNPMSMLNAHSYSKGGWVLLMLRNQLGNEVFWKAIQTYYATYKYSNASTADLQKVFENTSGKDLTVFFKQWLFTPENPNLQINWQYDAVQKKININVEQLTETDFVLPLVVKITEADGKSRKEKITVSHKKTSILFASSSKPVQIETDPDCELLMEALVKEIK